MWSPIICLWGGDSSGMVFSPLHSLNHTSFLGSTRGKFVGTACTNQCQHHYTLDNQLPQETLWLKTFNHPSQFQLSLCLFSFCLSSSSLAQVSGGTGRFRFLIITTTHLMETSWHLMVLNILKDIPHWCPIIIGLIRDVSVDWVLKGLPPLHITLGYAETCFAQTWLLFLSLSDSGEEGNLSIYNTDLPVMLERMGRLVCSKRCTKQCLYLPLNYLIVYYSYLVLDLLGVLLVFIVCLFQHPWRPHCHQKASNYL